jgi:hypothetical protein
MFDAITPDGAAPLAIAFEAWRYGRILGHLYKIAKSDYYLRRVSIGLSVCRHGTTRLPLDGYSLNLVVEYFSKISQNSSFIKT